MGRPLSALEPFDCALAECGIAADQIPRVANRLTRPPNSIGLSASDDSRLDAKIQVRGGKQRRFPKVERAFDSDMAARLLHLDQGRPNPKATKARSTFGNLRC